LHTNTFFSPNELMSFLQAGSGRSFHHRYLMWFRFSLQLLSSPICKSGRPLGAGADCSVCWRIPPARTPYSLAPRKTWDLTQRHCNDLNRKPSSQTSISLLLVLLPPKERFNSTGRLLHRHPFAPCLVTHGMKGSNIPLLSLSIVTSGFTIFLPSLEKVLLSCASLPLSA